MQHQEAIDYICKRLESELPVHYHYHNVKHTQDVISSCVRLAEMEGIEGHNQKLLETAAAYHDAGFLYVYEGHENKSVELIHQILPGFGFSQEEIGQIAQMILATILPQQAHDYLSMLLCDADLDYLGRTDFHIIAQSLREEWASQGRVYSDREWYQLQIGFLMDHSYYTQSAIALRRQGLLDNLQRVGISLAESLRSL